MLTPGRRERKRFDVLVKAIAQARNDEYRANAVMINVADWYNLLLLKDEDDSTLCRSVSFRCGCATYRRCASNRDDRYNRW
jgi:hypothetical protein